MTGMPWRPTLFHPLACARWPAWREALRRYGPISLRAWPTRILNSGASLLAAPRQRRELKRLRETVAEDSPVFIVGHWRSGTTHLHNLLHHTGRFATLRTVDAVNPLGNNPPDGALARAMNKGDRGFDKVAFGPEEPQEEEMALATLGTISIFHLVYFPRAAKSVHRRSIMLEGLEPGERDAFAEAYRLVAAKTRLVDGTQRPLLFKNPASTARLDFLREVFPEARFIHIVRHPLSVYQSTGVLIAGLAETLSLQSLDGLEKQDHRIPHYRMMMKAHLEQRERLKPGHYAEIRYEDLVTDPVAGVEKVLGALGWSLTDEERTRLVAYVDSLSGYKPNRHSDDLETARHLRRELAFAYDTWGYD